MKITLKMVQDAYRDIGGTGRQMREGFFCEGYDHGSKTTNPRCCGLAALYLQQQGGMLNDVNKGLGHLSESTLDGLSEAPETVIIPELADHLGESPEYINGWMMGFDDSPLHPNRTADFIEGHADGRRVGYVLFGEAPA